MSSAARNDDNAAAGSTAPGNGSTSENGSTLGNRKAVALRRGLGFWLLLAYGVGNILGAGIYVLVGEVTAVSGYHAPLAFIVSSVIAAFTGLSYAELAARFPLSAGEAVYVQQAFHRRNLAIVVGLLVCASGIISSATLCRGFIGYLAYFVDVSDALGISVLLVLVLLTALIGISQSVSVAALFTLLEVSGLVLVLWVGRGAVLSPVILDVPASLLPPATSAAWLGLFAGAFLAFFAFIGFEDMVNVAEEVRDPGRTIPLAIILALLLCSLLYAAIAWVAVRQLGPDALAASDAPLAAVYESATGRPPAFLAGIGLFAIINGVLIQLIMVSRILYGMARQHWLPGWLGIVSSTRRTPVYATLLTALGVWLLAMFLPLGMLAQGTSLVVLVIFALVNAALATLKWRDRTAPVADVAGVGFQVPFAIPLFGLSTSIGLLVVGLQHLR